MTGLLLSAIYWIQAIKKQTHHFFDILPHSIDGKRIVERLMPADVVLSLQIMS